MGRRTLARREGGRPTRVKAVRRGDREECDIALALREPARRFGRLGRDGARIGDDGATVRSGRPKPIAARDDVGGQRRGHLSGRLIDRARRQAKVGRAAIVRLRVFESEAQNDREFIDEGGLEANETVLSHADERRADRLMRTAFAGERDARGRRDEDEARVLIAGVVQRIGAAVDEGVVERADRDDALAVKRVRETEGRQREKQVGFSDAEFEMLAAGRKIPRVCRGDLLLAKNVGHVGAREEASAVHPSAEIGRNRHVGRGGDDASRERRVAPREFVEQEAEALLCRHGALRGEGKRFWHRYGLGLMPTRAARQERDAGDEGAHVGLGHGEPLEGVPLVPCVHARPLAEAVRLRWRQQARMIVLVALEGQAVTLHGVADEAGRTIARARRLECFEQTRRVVSAEIGHHAGELRVVHRREKGGGVALIAERVLEPAAPGSATLEAERRVVLVRAFIDEGSDRRAAGPFEKRLLQRTVFYDHDVPAEIAEHRLELLPESLAHDGVEALSVVVDDPPGVAQAVLPAVDQGFVDVALVHLGIAHQRDHLAAWVT